MNASFLAARASPSVVNWSGRALLAAFFAVACLAGPASAQNPIVAIDSNIAENQEISNTVRVIGFAVSPGSSGYVEVSLDSQNFGRASYPLPRNDVPNSGFVQEVDTLSVPNGSHVLKATAYSAAGAVLGTATKTVRVNNVPSRGAIESPSSTVQVVTSTATFTGWALGKGGFKRLEVQIDGLFGAAASYGTAVRTDIQQQFPEYNTANSGWSAPVNLQAMNLARGWHRVTLEGIDGSDERRMIAESYFFYTPGRVGRNAVEVPAAGAQVTAVQNARVAGWTSGDNPAARIDVYVDDRFIASSTAVTTPRPDVASAIPGLKNVAGFDVLIPGFDLGRGRHRLVVIVTDTSGQRANVDFDTGPVYFEVGDAQRLFGAHLRPSDNYAASITQYTTEAGSASDMVMYFQPWRVANGDCAVFNAFPFLPNAVKTAGARVIVTWEPIQEGQGFNQANFKYGPILAGTHNACIDQFAQQIKDYGSPVILRFMHEMQGESNNWTGVSNGNNPQGYIDVWRYVVDRFRAVGATNAKFMWAPDHAAPPSVPYPSSDMRNYWPGSAYVDFVGTSGYNWGADTTRGGGWQLARQIFENFLTLVLREFPGKPVILAEVGSVPSYSTYVRNDWYADAMAYFQTRKDVKGLVWFNDFAFALTTEPDLRITNTPNLPAVNATETARMKALIAGFRAARDTGAYVTVSEFYAPSLDHYFRTAIPEEAAALRANSALGFLYTNKDFRAYLRDNKSATALLVCRFYGSLTIGPNSHFYTADPNECQGLKNLQATTPPGVPKWNFEENAFAVDVPANGMCPSYAPVPVWRLYNNRAVQNDSNHRYTTDLIVYATLIARGPWKGEGIVMCSQP